MAKSTLSLTTTTAIATILLAFLLTSSSSAPTTTGGEGVMTTTTYDVCSNDGRCCSEDNYNTPGPLTEDAHPSRSDDRYYNELAIIFGCVQHFTSFLWFKVSDKGDDVPYPFGQSPDRFELKVHNQTLWIDRTTMTDTGLYRYVASNDSHTVTGNFSVTVYCYSSSVSVMTSEPPRLEAEAGTNKTLQCGLRPLCHRDAPQFYLVLWTWHYADDKWFWLNNTENNTLDGTAFVVCNSDTSRFVGQSCSLHVGPVRQQHYEGKFVCHVSGQPSLNQTVQFYPPVVKETSWLSAILGGTLAFAAVIAIAIALWFRYGHRIVFWLGKHPDRGNFQHDAVIVYDEDHEDFATKELKAGLQDLGYEVLVEHVARPGRPEALERVEAILTSYCVVFSLSQRELRDPQTDILTRAAMVKTRSSVVFIRCKNFERVLPTDGHANRRGSSESDGEDGVADVDVMPRDDATGDRPEAMSVNENETPEVMFKGGASGGNSPEQTRLMGSNREREEIDVWKNEKMVDFKVIDWPGTDHLAQNRLHSRQADRFWYKLRNNLPRLQHKATGNADRKSRGQGQTTRSRTDFNSCGSERRLLDENASGRTSGFRISDVIQTPTQAPDVDMVEEQRQTNFSSTAWHNSGAARPLCEDNEDEDDLFAGIPTDDVGLLDDHPYPMPKTNATWIKGQDGDPIQYAQVSVHDIASSPDEQREMSRDSLRQKYALRPHSGGSPSSAKQREVTPASSETTPAPAMKLSQEDMSATASHSAKSPPAQLQPPKALSAVADIVTSPATDLPQTAAPSSSSTQPHLGPQFNPLSTYPEDGNPPSHTSPDTGLSHNAHVPDNTPQGIQQVSDNRPVAPKFDPLRTYPEDAKDHLEGRGKNDLAVVGPDTIIEPAHSPASVTPVTTSEQPQSAPISPPSADTPSIITPGKARPPAPLVLDSNTSKPAAKLTFSMLSPKQLSSPEADSKSPVKALSKPRPPPISFKLPSPRSSLISPTSPPTDTPMSITSPTFSTQQVSDTAEGETSTTHRDQTASMTSPQPHLPQGRTSEETAIQFPNNGNDDRDSETSGAAVELSDITPAGNKNHPDLANEKEVARENNTSSCENGIPGQDANTDVNGQDVNITVSGRDDNNDVRSSGDGWGTGKYDSQESGYHSLSPSSNSPLSVAAHMSQLNPAQAIPEEG